MLYLLVLILFINALPLFSACQQKPNKRNYKPRIINTTDLGADPDDEQSMGVEILDEYGDDGIRDLAWALMNSPEFLFIQ